MIHQDFTCSNTYTHAEQNCTQLAFITSTLSWSCISEIGNLHQRVGPEFRYALFDFIVSIRFWWKWIRVTSWMPLWPHTQCISWAAPEKYAKKYASPASSFRSDVVNTWLSFIEIQHSIHWACADLPSQYYLFFITVTSAGTHLEQSFISKLACCYPPCGGSQNEMFFSSDIPIIHSLGALRSDFFFPSLLTSLRQQDVDLLSISVLYEGEEKDHCRLRLWLFFSHILLDFPSTTPWNIQTCLRFGSIYA